jgi:hypothetical protein
MQTQYEVSNFSRVTLLSKLNSSLVFHSLDMVHGGGGSVDGVDTCGGEVGGSMDGADTCGGEVGGGGGPCGGVEDVDRSGDEPDGVES